MTETQVSLVRRIALAARQLDGIRCDMRGPVADRMVVVDLLYRAEALLHDAAAALGVPGHQLRMYL